MNIHPLTIVLLIDGIWERVLYINDYIDVINGSNCKTLSTEVIVAIPAALPGGL